MNSKYAVDRTILIIIITATVVGFILWVAILVILWLVLKLTGVQPDFWAMMEALSTAVGAAAFLGASFVAYRELNEASRTRHLEVVDHIFNELNSPENIEARRWIYQHLPDDPAAAVSTLKPRDIETIKRVLNMMDRVAFLMVNEWVPEGLVMPWLNPVIVKTWIKLQPYIDYESERRKEPDYYQNVRILGMRCAAWRKENLPEAEIHWVEHAL